MSLDSFYKKVQNFFRARVKKFSTFKIEKESQNGVVKNESVETSLQNRDIEKHLVAFQEQFQDLYPVLKQEFIYAFLTKIREENQKGANSLQQLLNTLDQQKRELQLLDKAIREESLLVTRKTLLYNNQLFANWDLAKKAEEVMQSRYQGTIPFGHIVNEDVRKQVLQQLRIFFAQQLEEVAALVAIARLRQQKREEMARFQKEALQKLTQFPKDHEQKEAAQAFIQRVAALGVEKQKAMSLASDAGSSLLDAAYDEYLQCKKDLLQFFQQLEDQERMREQEGQEIIHTLKRRLFEIFSNSSLFPDLQEQFLNVRKMLCHKLQGLQEKLFDKSISLDAYRNSIFDLAYEHDLLLLRRELAFRATRLRELREALYRILNDMHEVSHLLEIAVIEKGLLYEEICDLDLQMKQFLHQLENPFPLFQAAYQLENVNQVFLMLWVRLEKLQKEAQNKFTQAVALLEPTAEKIAKEFLKTVDDLEEVVKETTGIRPNLVERTKQRLQEKVLKDSEKMAQIRVLMKALEKEYHFSAPLSFFMHIGDQRVRRKMLHESQELDHTIRATKAFAKSLQYSKVFDEERVDGILEAFEGEHYLEEGKQEKNSAVSAWSTYTRKMIKVALIIEQELLLDIGFLDMRALLDIEEKKLSKALFLALTKAREQLSSALENLIGVTTLKEGQLFKSIQESLIKKSRAWLEKQDEQSEGKSSQQLLKRVRSLCHVLFETQLFLASCTRNYSAQCTLIVCKLQHFVALLEEEQQEKRKGISSFWKPKIAECHALKGNIERLELAEESKEAFETVIQGIFQKIEEIPEVKKQSAVEKIKREELQQEIYAAVQMLDTAVKLPLHYLPGHLTFFYP
ncbi:MAG: hypothetical protein JWO53_596 [Chlamydiia bacterium]|nr:hypothetical protein [Chlamydiia bacterium]